MEALAFDLVARGEWTRAADTLNQLLAAAGTRKDDVVRYLVARSECFFQLKHYGAVIADCQRAINAGAAAKRHENALVTIRHRRICALFALRKYQEAELAVQEWVASKNGPNQHEVAKILKRLHASQAVNGLGLEAELNTVEAQLTAVRASKMDAGSVVMCSYCSIAFKSKMELRGHCQTEEHQRVIMSDEGRDWRWRPPPRGCDAESYKLCDAFLEVGVCRYSSQCIDAHGLEELQEWRERFEYRRMKLQRAYDSELYGKSYTEELVDKLVVSLAPELIMRENVDDVEVSCNNKLSTTLSEKNRRQTWIFTMKAGEGVGLKAVALLQDTHRAYFHIKSIKIGSKNLEVANQQEWLCKGGVVHSNSAQIEISFSADIYGTLRQSIVFDFGIEPMLVKHLCVDVVPVTDIDKINEIRKEILLSSSERWNSNNSEIVQFTSPLTSLVPSYADTESDWAKHLAAVYPAPHPETFMLSQSTIKEKRLTRNTYAARMHELLYIEEMARYECIARFNVTLKLKIIHSYLLSPNSTASSTAKYSSSGELFALMHLGKELSEDTSAGRLILNNCMTVLLSPEDNTHGKVYEALIEDKGKTMIYLRLSAVTVSELALKADTEFRAQMQFQLNRIPYCEWHYAIDKIPDYKVIFPEVFLEPNIPWTPSRQWSDSLDSRMNLKQKEAVVAITTPLYVNLPPVLIIGPFGTGKTFTLAQAIKQLVKQPESRVLICTQSNSAADLYIKDYLHPYVESGHESARPLRIYYHKRWVATVHQTVQKYCLINSAGGMKRFLIPTAEDIMKHRIVVVTLSISMYLSTIGLPRGFFTHIFLDEAAQAMECEAIMPLALANDNTRIVLAGDHMQLSPELFSSFAKERNLHVSLLERLYDHYPNGFPCKILLSENYRAHEAIIQFTSESFYDQKLISSGKQPRHEIFYPLTFFTSRGEDIQDLNSTAFYNNSEVYEIVERVQELKKLWPSAWGKFDDQSIGIMTPYSDQVLRIRSELRKRRLYGISVERVLNVQGKQFRAIFLSTVRTRRTCQAAKGGEGEDADFGFLSNSKLLNTAITRAQSLVAVVGDPISLCSAGRCSKVWERFIQICEENNSLFGITWLSLKNQLDGVELKKTYTLNPLAPEFIPRAMQQQEYMRPLQKFMQSPVMVMPLQGVPRPQNHQTPQQQHMLPVYPGMLPLLPPQSMMNMPNIPVQYFMGQSQSPRNLNIQPVGNPRVGNPNKPEDIGIQFRNNVHFPELPPSVNVPPPPQQVKPMSTTSLSTLTDYINLLPTNMSLAEMLLQPIGNQQRWYYTLLTNKGPDAAKQFEMLIMTANRKETAEPSIQHMQPQIQHMPFPPIVQQQQQFMNPGHPQLPIRSNSTPMGATNGAVGLPNYQNIQQMQTVQNLQGIQNLPQTNPGLTAMQYWKPPPHQVSQISQISQPLYLRQSGDSEGKHHKLDSAGGSGCSGMSSASGSVAGGNVGSPEMGVPRQWQQQINAEFAQLSLHNGETADDVFNRYKDSTGSTTYASVVRNVANISNIGNDKLSLSGPRLYQYF